MEWFEVCGRLLLCAVLAAAAIAKLRDRPGTRRSLAAFGVSDRLVAPGAWLLCVAELIVAAGLLVTVTARLAAAAAVALLAVFSLVVAVALRRGVQQGCNCFGQASASRLGPGTLVRNALLGLVALPVLVTATATPIPRWLSDRSTAELAALALAVATLALAIHATTLRRRLIGAAPVTAQSAPLEPGEPAPDFRATDAHGREFTATDLTGHGTGTALVFVAPGCHPCAEMLPILAEWQRALAEDLRVIVVHAGSERGLGEPLERNDVAPLVIDAEGAMMRAFRIAATPSALLVDAGGRIASRPVSGQLPVEMLVRSALRDLDSQPRQ